MLWCYRWDTYQCRWIGCSLLLPILVFNPNSRDRRLYFYGINLGYIVIRIPNWQNKQQLYEFPSFGGPQRKTWLCRRLFKTSLSILSLPVCRGLLGWWVISNWSFFTSNKHQVSPSHIQLERKYLDFFPVTKNNSFCAIIPSELTVSNPPVSRSPLANRDIICPWKSNN